MPSPSCASCYFSAACGAVENYPDYTNPLICRKPPDVPKVVWPKIWPVVEAAFWCVNYKVKPIYPGFEWIRPDSHTLENPFDWTDPANAYDNYYVSEAFTSQCDENWYTPFIVLNFITPALVDKIRYLVWSDYLESTIDIDIYYNGEWHNLYEGAYPQNTLTEVDLQTGARMIEKIRVRFNDVAMEGDVFRITEVALERIN